MRANSTNLKSRQKNLCNPLGNDTFHILLADDDNEMRKLLSQMFHKAGFAVTECINGIDLLMHLESSFFPKNKSNISSISLFQIFECPDLPEWKYLKAFRVAGDFHP